MEIVKRFEPVALLVIVLGALNWGMVGLFDTNVISEVFGSGTLTDVIYAVVGVCGLVLDPEGDGEHCTSATARPTPGAPDPN